ncbi:zinc finger protein 567-like [Anopheles bellator]|uniref:zinc finger protein 567-like n=1 Tax=Anopheles bellator TaxID=139047 RepID=UPI0026472634|nr:zinc finger protein 567-like [Anopheles bellator]
MTNLARVPVANSLIQLPAAMVQLYCRTCLQQTNHSNVVSVFSSHQGFVVRDALHELFDMHISLTEMLTTVCKDCLSKICTAKEIRVWFAQQNQKYHRMLRTYESANLDNVGDECSQALHILQTRMLPEVQSTTNEEPPTEADGAVQPLTVAPSPTGSDSMHYSIGNVESSDDSNFDVLIGNDSPNSEEYEFFEVVTNNKPNHDDSYELVQCTSQDSDLTVKRDHSEFEEHGVESVDLQERYEMSVDSLAEEPDPMGEEEIAVKTKRPPKRKRKSRTLLPEEDELKCSQCDKQFTLEGQLIAHGVSEHGEGFTLYQCETCDCSFATERSLQSHCDRFHGKIWKCRYCAKLLHNANALQGHENTHTNEKSFVCSICSQRFTQYTSMRRHRQMHNDEKRHECDICHLRFRQRGVMLAHRRIHTGEKPYDCTMCEKSFRDHSTFAKHRRTHSRLSPKRTNVTGVI